MCPYVTYCSLDFSAPFITPGNNFNLFSSFCHIFKYASLHVCLYSAHFPLHYYNNYGWSSLAVFFFFFFCCYDWIRWIFVPEELLCKDFRLISVAFLLLQLTPLDSVPISISFCKNTFPLATSTILNLSSFHPILGT